MKRIHRSLIFAVAFFIAGVAVLAPVGVFAVQPDEVLADAALEARARSISHGLRCLVCQNQSIDDSEAPLARDLRLIVRERLVAGDSDRQVQDFLVARYGDFVLLTPPFNASTVLLWLTPFLLLVFALTLVLKHVRSERPEGAAATALTPEEERALAPLLASVDETTSDGKSA